MNDPIVADIDDVEGFEVQAPQGISQLSNEDLYDRLDEVGYIDDFASQWFERTQMEGLSDWWAENVFAENQEQMENGEIPYTSMYSPFFTFHHGNDRRINPARQTPVRYWTTNRDLGNTMGMGPRHGGLHRTLEDTIDLYDFDFDWLRQYGATDEQIEYIDDQARERGAESERYDGGWSYWMPSNQRRPRDHPLYEDMIAEMIDQTEDDDEPLTEMSDGTFTGMYSEFLTDDNFLNGYYTTEEDIQERIDEVRQRVNDQDNLKEQFLNNLPQGAAEPTPVGEVSTDDPTEDLIALPSARIPLEDKIRMNRDIINP